MARSFAPEFSHTMDFPCNLIWTEPDNEALSLAEILERGQLHLEVWHQVPGLASGVCGDVWVWTLLWMVHCLYTSTCTSGWMKSGQSDLPTVYVMKTERRRSLNYMFNHMKICQILIRFLFWPVTSTFMLIILYRHISVTVIFNWTFQILTDKWCFRIMEKIVNLGMSCWELVKYHCHLC